MFFFYFCLKQTHIVSSFCSFLFHTMIMYASIADICSFEPFVFTINRISPFIITFLFFSFLIFKTQSYYLYCSTHSLFPYFFNDDQVSCHFPLHIYKFFFSFDLVICLSCLSHIVIRRRILPE